jgi:hypothetical protein
VLKFRGSFGTKREASVRKVWILGEIAAGRAPNLNLLVIEEVRAPTLRQAGERWQAARVDVAEATKLQQRVSLKLALPFLGERHVDEIQAGDVADLVAELAAAGKKPGTVRKALQAVAMVLDHAGVRPNPARDRVIVKLPKEEPEEINPPSAEHVAAVYRLLPSRHQLPLRFLDWSGVGVAAIDLTLVSDYDEPRSRIQLRAATTKSRRALWIQLPDVLHEAI